jgi:putative DNA primase/helicase
VTLSARCPLFLTSISMPINQPDLLDRCMVIHVPAMPCDKRQSEEQWQKEIDKAHPRLFGGLCNALAASLRNVNTVGVPGSVRMMDAAKWVTAAESALGFGPGEFVKLYSENQRDVRLGALDDDAFGTAVLEFTRTVRQFRGNVTQLEGRLSSYRLSRAVDWPAQKRIRRRLDELAPLLREHGVLVNTRLRGGPNNQKLIDLSSAIRLKRARATVPIRPANKV